MLGGGYVDLKAADTLLMHAEMDEKPPSGQKRPSSNSVPISVWSTNIYIPQTSDNLKIFDFIDTLCCCRVSPQNSKPEASQHIERDTTNESCS